MIVSVNAYFTSHGDRLTLLLKLAVLRHHKMDQITADFESSFDGMAALEIKKSLAFLKSFEMLMSRNSSLCFFCGCRLQRLGTRLHMSEKDHRSSVCLLPAQNLSRRLDRWPHELLRHLCAILPFLALCLEWYPALCEHPVLPLRDTCLLVKVVTYFDI